MYGDHFSSKMSFPNYPRNLLKIGIGDQVGANHHLDSYQDKKEAWASLDNYERDFLKENS
jgi:hypothetical protein